MSCIDQRQTRSLSSEALDYSQGVRAGSNTPASESPRTFPNQPATNRRGSASLSKGCDAGIPRMSRFSPHLPAQSATGTGIRTREANRLAEVLAAVFVGVVALSPTINVAEGQLIRYAAMGVTGVIAVAVLNEGQLTFSGKCLMAILGTCLMASLLANAANIDTIAPAKVVGSALVIFAAPLIYCRTPKAVLRLLEAMLMANLLVVIAQLLGLDESVYIHVTYANDAVPASIVGGASTYDPETQLAFLPQSRPSGLLPAPTYLSFFLILSWLMVVTNPASHSHGALLAFGAVAALSGSTLGVLLIAATLPWLRLKPSVLLVLVGYLLASAAYSRILPATFEQHNSLDDLIRSISNRVGEQDDGGSESILQTQPVVLAAVIFALGIATTLAKHFNLMQIARAGIAIVMPLLVHDNDASTYFMTTALAAQECLGFVLIKPQAPQAITGRRSQKLTKPAHVPRPAGTHDAPCGNRIGLVGPSNPPRA